MRTVLVLTGVMAATMAHADTWQLKASYRNVCDFQTGCTRPLGMTGLQWTALQGVSRAQCDDLKRELEAVAPDHLLIRAECVER